MTTQDTDTHAGWQMEQIETLTILWTEGHSIAEIGRRMGISKNAVVGKAHRLNLPARPHPIRDLKTNGLPAAPASNGSATADAVLPAKADTTAPPRSATPPIMPASSARCPAQFRPVTSTHIHAVVSKTVRLNRAATCCWPMGDPSTRSFRFCDAPPVAGKPYCGEHAAIAYVRRNPCTA